MSKTPKIEDMLKAGMHFGHRTNRWHPKMKPFIYTSKNGIYIINLKKSQEKLEEALNFMEKKESGKLEKYTKKERLEFDREIEKLKIRVGGLTTLNKLPDALFIWDIKEEETAVREAQQKNIPIIAICDTNVNPDEVNYPIPGNDDATKTITLVLATIKDSLSSVKQK